MRIDDVDEKIKKRSGLCLWRLCQFELSRPLNSILNATECVFRVKSNKNESYNNCFGKCDTAENIFKCINFFFIV